MSAASRRLVHVVLAVLLVFGLPGGSALAQEPTGSISGVVTNEVTDDPIGGVCIDVYGDQKTVPVTTAEDGSYTAEGLPPGDYSVVFNHRYCYSQAWVTEWYSDASREEDAAAIAVDTEPVAGVDAALEPTSTIQGRVTNVDGKALSRVCVNTEGAGGNNMTLTDLVGRFEITGVRAGSYLVHLWDCNQDRGTDQYLAEWWQDAYDHLDAAPVEVAAGQVVTIDPQLSRGASVSGVVTDNDGNAVPDICVSAEGPDWRSASTGADGTYTVGGLTSGTYRFSFSACGGGQYQTRYYEDDSGSDEVVLTADEVRSGLDVQLARLSEVTGTITGVIADTAGQGVEGICVSAQGDDHRGGVSGSDGSYALPNLSPGDYRIRFHDCTGQSPMYRSEWWQDASTPDEATVVAVQTGDDLDVSPVVSRGASISGVVRDSSGSLLERVCVALDSSDENHWNNRHAETNADGAYSFEHLDAGEYSLTFSSCGDMEYAPETITVAVTEGQIVGDADASLVQTPRIVGVLQGTDGQPLADVCVYAEGRRGWASAQSLADGSFVLKGLGADGNYIVGASSCEDQTYLSEYYDAAATYETAKPVYVGSGTVDIGTMTLERASIIRGQVEAADAGAIEGICVNAEGRNGFASATTTTAGAYELAGLSAGQYRISFTDCTRGRLVTEWWNDSTRWDESDLVDLPHEGEITGIDAVLEVGGGLTGSVIDQNAVAVAQICVTVDGPGGARGVVTDRRGRFSLTGLQAGTYTAHFADCYDGSFAETWYLDASTASDATPIEITAGSVSTLKTVAMGPGSEPTPEPTPTAQTTPTPTATPKTESEPTTDSEPDAPADGGGSTGGGGGGAVAPAPAPSEEATAAPSDEPTPEPTSSSSVVTKDVEAGETVSTGDSVTAEEPLAIAVTASQPGTVSIESREQTASVPSGYTFLGHEVIIQAPDGTVNEPLKLDFRLHESEVPADGEPVVFRNGQPVSTCTQTNPIAPDPCVQAQSSDGDALVFTVLTSRASVWNFGVALTACSSTAASSFSDVGSDFVHAESIDCVVSWGLARGFDANHYGPLQRVTRAQMATFIASLITSGSRDLPAGRDAFSDDNRNPHEAAINKLAAAGVVRGTGATTYSPNEHVTRDQMASFLVAAYEYMTQVELSPGGNVFTDDDGSMHEANINKAAAAGLTRGKTARQFDPRASVQRGAMASFLRNTLDLMVKEGIASRSAA